MCCRPVWSPAVPTRQPRVADEPLAAVECRLCQDFPLVVGRRAENLVETGVERPGRHMLRAVMMTGG
jgi:hypothetical protein